MATETEDSRTFEQMTNTIAVAHNLWDRQEADWIAAEILAAAERQTVSTPAPSDTGRRRPRATS
jgi:hypothetical protein